MTLLYELLQDADHYQNEADRFRRLARQKEDEIPQIGRVECGVCLGYRSHGHHPDCTK